MQTIGPSLRCIFACFGWQEYIVDIPDILTPSDSMILTSRRSLQVLPWHGFSILTR